MKENIINYIELEVVKTSKDIGSKDDYRGFDNSIEKFKGIKEAKEWLQEEYDGRKRVEMYRDNKDGTARQTGWIYCFKNKDISHNSKWWYQQDWISAYTVEKQEILLV